MTFLCVCVESADILMNIDCNLSIFCIHYELVFWENTRVFLMDSYSMFLYDIANVKKQRNIQIMLKFGKGRIQGNNW